uniref:Uncharacterized protein n=1 Tax=Ananas comosus var. bracteatus TaxID=296719 RepID=A0A6V7PSW6_ANACO|nr:unnamed protein product [Ananas comosus var. bracteatus]
MADTLNEIVLLDDGLAACVPPEGLIEEEKVESFNAPYYAPSMEEVKDEVTIQGSFSIRKIELLEVNWDDNSQEAPQDGHNSNPTQMKNGTIPHQVAKSAQTMAKGIELLLNPCSEAILEKLLLRSCLRDTASCLSSFILRTRLK